MKTLKRFLHTFWIKKPKITNGSKYYLAKRNWERVRGAVNSVARAYGEICKLSLTSYSSSSAQNYRSPDQVTFSYNLLHMLTSIWGSHMEANDN